VPRPRLTLVVAAFVLTVVSPGALRAVAPEDPQPGDQAPVFSAGASLVTVDVVVLDEAGEPVEGLTAEDFTVLDEGRARALSRFEAVALPESPATESPARSFVSTNTPSGNPTLRTFVVVFDDVHMGRTTALRAKDAVWDFVGTLREGDQVSLVSTSGGAWWHVRIPEGRRDLGGALRRLTGRRPRRHAADRMSDYEAMLLHVHRDPHVAEAVTRRYVDNGILIDRDDPNEDIMPSAPREVRNQVLGYTFTHPMILGRAAEVYYDMLARRKATYDTLERVARALEATRGRKSILFISEGFVQEPGYPEHRDMIRASQRANAVVHFIDARGLVGLPDSADVEMGRATGGLLSDSGDVLDQMNLPLLESLGAVSLALDTGGEVIRNQNDLARGLKRIERESRAYYLLGFEPAGVPPDGKFHELEVSVGRAGTRVLARKGYYAPSTKPERTDDHDEILAPGLRRALESPFDANAIPLRVVSYVLGPAKGGTTVLLVADVDPRGLAFEEKDGHFDATLEFHLAVTQRDSGETIHRGDEVQLSLLPAAYEQVRRNKLPLMIDVPLGPGRHQARLLVRDTGTGLLGTVRHDLEVPAPGAFRVSTPILTDVIAPASEEDSSLVKPRPLARRTFVSGGTLTLLYHVYGARAEEAAPSRVTAGFQVESANGLVVATGPVALLPPGPEGQLAQLADFSLEDVPAGVYSVVVRARDEGSGETAETRFPFRVAPRPGTAVLEETVPEGQAEDPLDRVRGYLLGYGETHRE